MNQRFERETPLPANQDAERYILGAILMDDKLFALTNGSIQEEDFSLEQHRAIFRRMTDLYSRGERFDRVTVYNELMNHKEAEAIGGLSYLVSLDDGMPQNPSLDSYVRIVHEKAILRRAILSAETFIKQCTMEIGDATELMASASRAFGNLASSDSYSTWMNPGDVMRNHPGGLNGFLQPPPGGHGVPTPWPNVTRMLSGLQKGDLVIVGGRPGMGKSIVGMQLAHHIASISRQEPLGAAFFSLEMSKDSLIQRLISGLASVDHGRFRIGTMDKEERRRVQVVASDIAEIPLWIDDSRARTESAMRAALIKLKAKHPIRLIVVDHLQLMKSLTRREGNRHQEISDISHSMKHLAVDFDATVVLISQLGRQCEREKRLPVLPDLRESGTIEEDADVVMLVHREERYATKKSGSAHPGESYFIIAKQRNGPTGNSNLLFQNYYQRFVEVAPQSETGEYV